MPNQALASRYAGVAVIGLGLLRSLSVQAATPQQEGAAAITAAEVSRHMAVLAYDSMRYGVARGDSLEQARVRRQAQMRVARYVAAQFRQLGLLPYPAPTGDGVQYYPQPGGLRLDYARSSIEMAAVRRHSGRMVLEELGNGLIRMNTLNLGTTAPLLAETGPPVLGESRMLGSNQVTLLAGPQSAGALDAMDLRSRVIIYIPPTNLDAATRLTTLTHLYAKSRGVILVSDEDSIAFARRAEQARAESVGMVDRYLWESITPDARGHWVVAVRPPAVAGLLGWADLELSDLRAATAPVQRDLSATEFWLWSNPEQSKADSVSAGKATWPSVPYVEARLEGTDSVLKQQSIVLAANLRLGDDGRELAGLLALARAFSQPGARPRRSVLFVATMDTPPVLTSSWFVASSQLQFGKMAAALTLERLHETADTVVIDGGREVTLAAPPTVLAATRPELGFTVIDTGTTFRLGTVAYPFVRNLTPSLALYAGGPVSSAGSAASPASADKNESGVTVLRFAFYLANELATTLSIPRWTAVGRERYAAASQPSP